MSEFICGAQVAFLLCYADAAHAVVTLAHPPVHVPGGAVVSNGRGVGAPVTIGQLPRLQGEVAHGRGAVTTRDPVQLQPARLHLSLGNAESERGLGTL